MRTLEAVLADARMFADHVRQDAERHERERSRHASTRNEDEHEDDEPVTTGTVQRRWCTRDVARRLCRTSQTDITPQQTAPQDRHI